MGQRHRWQFLLILAVIFLTIYNVLPTLFYYLKPLKDPVSPAAAEKIGVSIVNRVASLEAEAKDWILSYCDLIQIKPQAISINSEHPQVITVSFAKTEEARRLRAGLPRAGSLIPFAPAQLLLLPQEEGEKEVHILRKLPIRLEREDFSYRSKEEVSIPLHRETNVSGYLALDQRRLAQRIVHQLVTSLPFQWMPRHPDLASLQIVDGNTYRSFTQEEKNLAIVVLSPLLESSDFQMEPSSLYIALKGIDKIAKTYEQFPECQLALDFSSDATRLHEILQKNGFVRYPGLPPSHPLIEEGDLLFEKPHFASALLDATRESFVVCGTQSMALIELRDVEQRMNTENKIETAIHGDLLKWEDDYRGVQVNIDPRTRFDVPKPTKWAFWENVLLSVRKYFRGDDRKIIRWGLDLSGGKTVELELRDGNHRPVTGDADLKQGIHELYNRVNKMGVSEVSIRQVGHHITLDFPGSQAMSASELIQASSLYFHVVNEKFSPSNPNLASSVNRFLQGVWNEATATGKRDSQSINAIAYNHLCVENPELRTGATQELWENGLRLALWDDPNASSRVDDSLSKIALFREEEIAQSHGQTHPLLIVFRNWALEGASLQNIRAGHDPAKGNFLSFDVASNCEIGGKKIQPGNDFHAWTSRYSKEKIIGTPLENETRGRGWRMAVVLNDSLISAPTLDSALKKSAMISGNFSPREVNRLVADLKAGSLTFTPHILSEKNISPELGQSDRLKGITATLAALGLVLGSMLVYYRFAGLIASIAVLFNLFILWATLQNLGATVTLAGLAAIVLTIGMAVDANVLVFERIREEFALSGNIRSALSAGYKKAYSAIIDSNVTTIIAALILLRFDAGPIKSFAVNLIIGIASSMFTALFMTRFYFTGWVQKSKNTTLKMANWIGLTDFDFLRWTKLAFVVAGTLIVIGCSSILFLQRSIFGMDFTGGYCLNVELAKPSLTGALEVEKALLSAGASNGDFQVRKLNPSHQLRILFGTTMELPGKPFHGMPIESKLQDSMKNPRIEWIIDALHKEGLTFTPHSLSTEFNWTAVSGQMSSHMSINALTGLIISLLCIFIYLSFRFEYKFAIAALSCLVHDVLITLGSIGLLHACGLEIQIDLSVIAALMTIVGYSLNDTIIIFDRIREEMKNQGPKKISAVVNHALNATLSRTTITSGTTLLVLIALIFLGGQSMFGFSLVMAIGVLFGTLSSWFIASPLMIFFHRREPQKVLKDVVQIGH